jgi:hypothetical protein
MMLKLLLIIGQVFKSLRKFNRQCNFAPNGALKTLYKK